jgi:hypothetical protein
VDSSGNCYVTGGYSSPSANFSSLALTNSGGYDFFLAKYDASGVVQWVRRGGGPENVAVSRLNGIAVDPLGHSYVSGVFRGTATFGTQVLSSAGSNDVFIAKYDPAGAFLWARQAGGIGNENDFGTPIAVDANGNCYISGGYVMNAVFGGIILPNAGDHDVFIAKYDANGVAQYAQRAGGKGYDYCRGISVDRNGNCYITGRFTGGAEFGSSSLTSTGNNDLFFAKLASFNSDDRFRLETRPDKGIPSFDIFALTGRTVSIESATDMGPNTQWSLLTNLTISSNPYRFQDETFTNQIRRFYRAGRAP